MNMRRSNKITISGRQVTVEADNLAENIKIGEDKNRNIVLGSKAMDNYTNSVIGKNVSIGFENQLFNSNSIENVSIGNECLKGSDSYINSNYNVAIGYQCGENIGDNSTNNVLIGYRCAKSSTGLDQFVGDNNTYIGYQCGLVNTSGSENVAIGTNCLDSNTTGNQNVAIGKECLQENISGTSNVALGYQSLYSNTASNNTAIGYKCSYFNSSGQYNTAIGYKCLEGETDAYTETNANVAIGYQCGQFIGNDTINNVLIGYECAKSSTGTGEFVGNNNTYIGYQCGLINTSGSENVAIGTNCLNLNTTGSQNVAIGKDTLQSNVTGNTVVGYRCLSNVGSLSSIVLSDINTYNVAIGTECSFQLFGKANTAIGTQCLASDFTYSTINTTNDSMFIEPIYFILSGSADLHRTSSISDTIKLNTASTYKSGLAKIKITENSTSLDTGNYSIKFDFKMSLASPTENYFYIIIGSKKITTNISSNNQGTYSSSSASSWFFQKNGLDPKEGIFNGIVIMFKTLTTTDSILVYYDNNSTSRAIISEASTSGSINFGTDTFRSYTLSYVSSTKLLTLTDGIFTKTYSFNGITNINDDYITFGSSTHHTGDDTTNSENYISNIKFSLSLVNSINNTAIGFKNLFSNASGELNTAIGSESLYSNKSGYNNVSIGSNTLYNNDSGYENTSIGYNSSFKNTDGHNNITIGTNASYNNRSGNNNVICGNDSNFKSEYNSNNIIYGNNNLYNAKGGYNTIMGIDNISTSKYYIYGKTNSVTSTTLVLDSETYRYFTNNDNRYKIYIGWKICFTDNSGAGITRTITDMSYSSPLYTITVDSAFPPFSEIGYRYYKLNITRPIDDGQFLTFSELALYDENDNLIIGAGTTHTTANATLTGTAQHLIGSLAGAFDNVINSTSGSMFVENNSGSPATGYLQIDFGNGVTKKVGMYRIWARPGFHTNQAPKDWSFEASNDGSNWVVLDRRAGITTWPAVSGTNASSNIDKANEFRKIRNGSDPICYKLYFDLYNSIKNDMDIEFGYIIASSNNTITLKRQSSLINDHYSNKRYYVKIVDSPISSDIGQIRVISDYNSSTNVITVNSNWSSNPSINAKYRIFILLEFLHSYEVSGTSTQNSFGIPYYFTGGRRGQRYEGSDLLFVKNNSSTISNYGKLNRITDTHVGSYGTTFHRIFVEFPFDTLPVSGDRVIFYDEKISEHNVLIGYKNSNNEIDSKYNIAIGNENLANNCNSIQNIVIGNFSLFNVNYSLNKIHDKDGGGGSTLTNDDLSLGGFNIGLGLFSSFHNTIGKNNISLGTESLYNNQKGDNNIAIGYKALKGLIGEKGSASYPKGRLITPTENVVGSQNDAFISPMFQNFINYGTLNSQVSEFKYAGNTTFTGTFNISYGGSSEKYIQLTRTATSQNGLFWNDKYRFYNNFPDTFLLEFDLFMGNSSDPGGNGMDICIGDKYFPPYDNTSSPGIANGYLINLKSYYYPSADNPYSDHAIIISYATNNDINSTFPWGYDTRHNEGNTLLKRKETLIVKKVEADESSDQYYSHQRGFDNDTWQSLKILFNRGEFTILKDNYILCKYIDKDYSSRNLSGATDRPYIWWRASTGEARHVHLIKNIKFSENISNLDVNPYSNVSALGPYAGNFNYDTLITTPIVDYDVFIGGGEGDNYQLIHANCNNTSRNWSPAVNNAVDLGTSTKAWKDMYISGKIIAPLHIYKDDDTDNNLTEILRLQRHSNDINNITQAEGGYISMYTTDDNSGLGEGARISWRAENSPDTGEDDVQLGFWTLDDDNLTEKMTITATGNVGIGTTAPESKLQVEGNIRIHGGSGGKGSQLDFGDNNRILKYTSNDTMTLQSPEDVTIVIDNNNNGSSHFFNIKKDSTDPDSGGTELFRVQENGNVGIGTNNPSYKLEVNGNGYFSSNLTINGDFNVNGETTIINSTTLQVEDKNIELGKVSSPSNTTADGGGITLKGTTDKTILWNNSNSNWNFSENISITTGKEYKINNVSVLNATTLGTNVISSSLTSVGTLNSGSITSGFGNINIGSSTLGCGAITSGGNLAVTGTITGDTSLTLDSTTITTAEIGVLDSVTPGTAAASKALVLDTNKDIATIRNLTTSGNIKTNNIIESYDGNTINYVVTVGSKTSAHPYNGTGSSSGYLIDGVESPFIEFVPKKTYKFDQSDGSNSTHPLRFYHEANKTTSYTTNVTTNGTPGSSGAYTQIVVTTTTPRTLFYMCSAHGYMGNQVQVKGGDIVKTGTIISGTWNGTSIAVANGGTGQTSYTDGQLLIGNTSGNTLTKGTITAGTGISITNGNGSITVANTVTNTNTTYSTSFVDDNNDAILRLTAGGSGSGNDDLKFVAGSNITLTPSGDNLTIASTASGSAITVQDEGSSLSTAAAILNFVGSGVTASGTGSTKTITISGGGGGGGDDEAGPGNGIAILDSKTITTNTQNIDLDAGTNHANYEYFAIVCIDIIGTTSGYIVWQPVDTSNNLHSTTSNSKWETTNLTDGDEENITQLTTNYHILGYHTLGKQHIKTKIFGLNKSDKKYSTFKNVGLHSTGIETMSQEGTTSQVSTTICKKIRVNNYSQTGTLGNISSGTIILYGYKKTANTLIPLPSISDAGKSLQVNSSGNGYEFSNGTSLDGSIILDTQTISSNTQNVQLNAGTNHTSYEYFSIKCIDVLGTLGGYIVWQPVNTSGSLHGTETNSKWDSTNLTDDTNSLVSQKVKDYHILGFHTLGKQYIDSKIYGLNKSDKKYCTFKNIGLHSTGTETNSQEGYTSQISTTECKQIRLNNFGIDGTLGNINTGTFILYGHKKTGIVNSTLIPAPTTSNIGKILQVNNQGDDYEFIPNPILNNRIDGDLTIGEDDSEILTIASKIHIPSGTTGQVLTKQSDGLVMFADTSQGLTLANDTSTNSFHVIPFSSSTTGEVSTLKTQSTIGVNPSTGNIGIGINDPDEKLEVNGNVKATGSKISDSIVQTAYKKYDKFITSNTGNWNDIDSNTSTGLVVSLTPSSANSKLLFSCTLHISVDNTDDSRWWGARLYRKIGSGSWAEVTGATNNQSSSRPGGTGVFMASHHQAGDDRFIQNLSNTYLDDANDNSNIHYYTIYWKCRLGSNSSNKTIYLNRADDSGDAYRALPISSLTLQEIYYP